MKVKWIFINEIYQKAYIVIAINNNNNIFLVIAIADTHAICTLLFIPLCTNTDGFLQFD